MSQPCLANRAKRLKANNGREPCPAACGNCGPPGASRCESDPREQKGGPSPPQVFFVRRRQIASNNAVKTTVSTIITIIVPSPESPARNQAEGTAAMSPRPRI